MRTQYVPVARGDVVEVVFEYNTDKGPHFFYVLEVNRRYGIRPNGEYHSPLIFGRNKYTGETQYFDNRLVTTVLSRAKVPLPPVNMYKNKKNLVHIREAITVRGSTWEGRLTDLAAFALSKLSYQLDRPIHVERLLKLYLRDQMGMKKRKLVMRSFYVYTVDSRRFMEWVTRNHTRVMMTVSELTTVGTESLLLDEYDFDDLSDFDELPVSVPEKPDYDPLEVRGVYDEM